jgi:anti-sigma factor RsiW
LRAPECYGDTVTCSWCEERFERFIDGDLSDGDRARLLAHVDGCDACRGLLEELRVVDALLLTPRTVELPENFTFATMADVRALPHPCPLRTPLAATLIAYVVGAWSLLGAAALIAPQHVISACRSIFAVAGTVLAAFAGLWHTFVHLGDRTGGYVTTLAGGALVADGVVLVAVVLLVRAVRPRIAERLRW